MCEFMNNSSHLIELNSLSLENLIGFRASKYLLNVLAIEL